LSSLTPSTSWVVITLPDGRVLIWSGDDQKGAFFVWSLPEAWLPFMTICKPVPGHRVGRPDLPMAYLSLCVIPMGWILAVTLFQHLHRRLGFEAPPMGAGFAPGFEWRKDAPLPLPSLFDNSAWIQYYLDDFDAPQTMLLEEAVGRRGKPSELQLRQRALYKQHGVEWADSKAHLQETKVERMGALVDGEWGRVSSPLLKLLEVGHFAMWILSLHWVVVIVALMCLGRLVRAFEFRRASLES
jgi:hypothetical protein